MSKVVTINDVARASGFGIGTVSRVLSGDKSVKPATRERINQVIEELHYVRNVNGARLRQKNTGVIAVLVPVINHPFFAEFLENVEIAADKEGWSLLVIASQMNEQKEKEILLKIRQHEIDGGIFVTHYEHSEEELTGCPLVSIDRHLPGNVPLVSSDNYDSTRKALELLYSHGKRRIGFIGTKPIVDSEVVLRKKAYDDFVAEKGLPNLSKWEATSHGNEPSLVESFLNEFQDLDAIFASNGVLALHTQRHLLNKGIRIPDDIELIGNDGVSPLWGAADIDCIQQDIKAMAETSFHLLRDLIEGKEVDPVTIIPTTLILGHTTKA